MVLSILGYGFKRLFYLWCWRFDLPIGDVKKALKVIYNATKTINDDKKVMMVGGEHLVSYGVIKALVTKYPDLHIIHLDAHTDLRDEFWE